MEKHRLEMEKHLISNTNIFQSKKLKDNPTIHCRGETLGSYNVYTPSLDDPIILYYIILYIILYYILYIIYYILYIILYRHLNK